MGKRGGLEGPWGWRGRAFWSDFLFQLFLLLSLLPASRFLAVSAEGRGLPESGGPTESSSQPEISPWWTQRGRPQPTSSFLRSTSHLGVSQPGL